MVSALSQGRVLLLCPSQAIDYIFKNAFYETSKATVFAAIPCAFTTAGTGFCMGIIFTGFAQGGPKPQDPAYYVDGIQVY